MDREAEQRLWAELGPNLWTGLWVAQLFSYGRQRQPPARVSRGGGPDPPACTYQSESEHHSHIYACRINI